MIMSLEDMVWYNFKILVIYIIRSIFKIYENGANIIIRYSIRYYLSSSIHFIFLENHF